MTAAAKKLPIAPAREVRKAVSAAVGEHRGLAVATVALAALAALSGLVSPWAIGLVVDVVLRGGEVGEVVTLTVVVAGAGVLGAALTAVSGMLVARIGQQVLARMREDAVAAALRLPAGDLEESGRGDLLSRVGDDVAVVSQLVASQLAPLVGGVLTVGLTIAGLFALDPWLALAGMLAVPVYGFSLRWYLPRAAPRYAAERAAFADRNEALVSTLEGLRTVRVYGAEDAHAEKITTSSAQARDLSRDVLWFATAWGKWMNIAELVGLTSIVVVGFLLVRGDLPTVGVVTVGAVTAAALYFHRLFNPLGFIVFAFDDVLSAGASLARIVGVAQAAAAADEPASHRDAGEITVRGVSHSYGDVEVLHDVSVTLAPGERVALVGASGAGKSTLAVIAAGLLEATSGTVELDGTPVGRFRFASPRPVVLVSQEMHVFAGTVADDLRLVRPDASGDDITRALATVGADRWVAGLPDGVDTVVGELGHALDAEQVAQLSLARAVLADPAVLILDEATAESGSRSAAALERAAAAVLEGRTGLVVAHRLHQARDADRVLVMDHGRIVEAGTHDDLLAAGGHYAALWAAWAAPGAPLPVPVEGR